MKCAAEFVYRDRVRYSDCDMHAHLNHARFFSFMEQARVGYLEAIGLPPGPRRETIPFIIVHAACDYRAPALINEEIAIAIGVTEIGRTSLTMEYQLTRISDATLLATAKTVMVSFDYQTMQPMAVPQDLRDRIVELKRRAGVTLP